MVGIYVILLFRKEIVWFSDLQTNLFQDLLAMHGLIVFVILISYESLTNWNLTSTQINWNCLKIPTSLWEYHNPDLDNFDDKYMTHYDLKCGKKQHDIWVNQKRFFLSVKMDLFLCVTKVYFLHFIKWQKFNSLCDPWWVLAVKSVPVMKQSWDPTVSKNILAGWFHLLIDMRKKYYCLSENLELVSIPPISGFVLYEKLQNFLF